MDVEVLWKKLHFSSTLKGRQDLDTGERGKGIPGRGNCEPGQVTSQWEREEESSEEPEYRMWDQTGLGAELMAQNRRGGGRGHLGPYRHLLWSLGWKAKPDRLAPCRALPYPGKRVGGHEGPSKVFRNLESPSLPSPSQAWI